MKKAPGSLSTIALACLAGGCTVNVYAPPTLTSLDHQVQPLAPGQTAVTGALADGGSPTNVDTGELTATAGVARGISERLELAASVAVGRLSAPGGLTGGGLTDGETYELLSRFGAKVPLLRATHQRGLAMNGVIGAGVGGVIDVGSVASFDVGYNIGYQNCVITPTIAQGYYLSSPLSRETILARTSTDDSFSAYQMPRTQGVVTSLGVTLETSRQRCLRDSDRTQIVLHLDHWMLSSAEDSDGTARAGAAVRYRF
ncbi:MAG: hypothetical protein IPL79_11045 [Myxococcales bacterium]|nr:hypothetical protein [Myxococcales bacterium]